MVIGKIKILPLPNGQVFKESLGASQHIYVNCKLEDGSIITGTLNTSIFGSMPKLEEQIRRNRIEPQFYFLATCEIKNFNIKFLSTHNATKYLLGIKSLTPCEKDSPDINIFSFRGQNIAEKQEDEQHGTPRHYTVACNKIIVNAECKDIKSTYIKFLTKKKLKQKSDLQGIGRLIVRSNKIFLEELFVNSRDEFNQIVLEDKLL